MPLADPLPVRQGDVLAGKYRVERVLGSGGMGIVVAARHVQLDQLVAIKFVREDALADESAVERFLREARAAVRLKSEHAARVLDVGTLESGAPYMVMEFLEGSDLGAVLEKEGPAAVTQAADWVLQACEAVAEAHAAGIVHRDLKPQNLFLARMIGGVQGIKVLDFGVSKSTGPVGGGFGSLTRTRTMIGSPLYMAPEQMRSARDVDARADVWALGVVLYELLTRRWPFEAETMPDLCLKVVSEPPTPLSAHRSDVPQVLVEVIERCLSKEPGKRFANAAELASALEPHAPAASRIWAERARLAVSGPSKPGLSAGALPAASPSVAAAVTPGSKPLESKSTLQSASEPVGVRSATVSAWGSGAGASGRPPKGRARTAAVLALAAVAIAGAALWIQRPSSRAPSSTSVAPPMAVSEPAAPALPPVAATSTASATSAGPPATAMSASSSATEHAAGAPVALPSAEGAEPPHVETTSVVSLHPLPTAVLSVSAKAAVTHPHGVVPPAPAAPKAVHTDDDIPALR